MVVNDEEGRSQRFGTYNGSYYFPMPSGRVEKKRYMNTLTRSGTTYTYTKKFGTTLTFQEVTGATITIDADRTDGGAGQQRYRFARLTEVEDKFGNQLVYHYPGNSLIPDLVYDPLRSTQNLGANPPQVTGIGLEIKLSTDHKRIEEITDPRGYVTEYRCPTFSVGGSNFASLDAVAPPGYSLTSSTNSPNTVYTYEGYSEQDQHPRASANPDRDVDPYHFRLKSITDGKGYAHTFTYTADETKEAYHEDAASPDNRYVQTGQPSLLTKVDLPGSRDIILRYSGESGFVTAPGNAPDSDTHIHINDETGSEVSAYKMTYVRDAEGHGRWWEFTEPDVMRLDEVPGNQRPDEDDESTELIVSFQRMDIQCADLGTETYEFDPDAGYALTRSTDFSGNLTTYEYEDGHLPDAPEFAYLADTGTYGYFDDPTAQIDALGQAKTFAYHPDWRVMNEIVDVDGSTTTYDTDDPYGRRKKETVADAGGNVLQETEFLYHADFKAFLEWKKIKDLSFPDEPTWVQQRSIRYLPFPVGYSLPYRRGRLQQERVYNASSQYLRTLTYHDQNGNLIYHFAPENVSNSHRTNYYYDALNRLIQVRNPDLTNRYLRYDRNSNRVAEQDERGHWTVSEYDELNRVVKQGRDMNGNAQNGSDYTLDSADLYSVFAYNDVGSVEHVTDPRGFVTDHSYDAMQRKLTTATPHEGDLGSYTKATTSFLYDGANAGSSIFNSEGWKPTTVTDPRGYETTVGYDPLYRESSHRVQVSLGSSHRAETLTTYDDANRTVTTVDPLGEVGEQVRDALGRVVTATVAKGKADEATTTNHYTSTGLLWRTVDAEGRHHEFRYDNAGRKTRAYGPDFQAASAADQKLVDPTNSPVTLTAYDKNSNIVSVTDPEGNETLYQYDNRDRKTVEISAEVTDAITGTRTYRVATLTKYDAAGNATHVVDRRGLDVDDGVSPISVTEHLTPPAPSGEGVMGLASDYTTETVYDPANRPHKIIYPPTTVDLNGDGNTQVVASETETVFDANGNAIEIKDGNGNITLNTYDPANRLQTTTTNPSASLPPGSAVNPNDPNDPFFKNITVSNSYDEAGNLEEVVDGEGGVTRFEFDGLGRKTLTTFDPDDSRKERTRLVYDDLNLTDKEVLDANGGVVESTAYTHDHLHRLKTVTFAGSTDDNRTYEYDKVGNLLHVKVGANPASPETLRSVSYTYNTLNLVEDETSAGVTHTATYDKAGNRTQVVYGNGKTITSEYDALNRLKKCTEGTRVTKFSHDLAGNLRTRQYPTSAEEKRTHDNRNRLTELEVDKSGSSDTCAHYLQHYDHLGNVTWIDEDHVAGGAPDRILTLSYDKVYRLTGEDIARGSSVQTTAYQYDRANNRTEKTVGGAVPSGVTTGTWNYVYGAAGGGNDRNSNQLYQITKSGAPTITLTYDAKGNLTHRNEDNHTLVYGYDHENRLIGASLPSGYTIPGESSALTNSEDYTFAYDYRTRRVHRHERPIGNDANDDTISFSGGTSVQEYHNGLDTTPEVHYVRATDFGGGIGGILYSTRGTTHSYFHYNSRGDVTTKTDSAQNSTWQTAYGAFGEHLDADTQSGSSNPDPQRGNTKEETGDLRIRNERYRYFFIDLGIFGQRDPVGFVDGPNVYSFVRQNPWSAWDTHGLSLTMAGGGIHLSHKGGASEIAAQAVFDWDRTADAGLDLSIEKQPNKESFAKKLGEYLDKTDGSTSAKEQVQASLTKAWQAVHKERSATYKRMVEHMNSSGYKLKEIANATPGALATALGLDDASQLLFGYSFVTDSYGGRLEAGAALALGVGIGSIARAGDDAVEYLYHGTTRTFANDMIKNGLSKEKILQYTMDKKSRGFFLSPYEDVARGYAGGKAANTLGLWDLPPDAPAVVRIPKSAFGKRLKSTEGAGGELEHYIEPDDAHIVPASAIEIID